MNDEIVVLNCQKCNQCLTGRKSRIINLQHTKLFGLSTRLKPGTLFHWSITVIAPYTIAPAAP